MKVPFVDLGAQYGAIKTEVNAALERVMEKSAFVGGDEVRAFDAEFAAYCAAPDADSANGHATPTLHCASCANGTDAIYLTLRALGIGRGDEVITVAHTFIATAAAVAQTGARPVFVDILEDTMLMDPDAIEAAITPKTRAILVVHLYGQTCEMDRIRAIADRHGLKVVEDAAQAHGARWQGQRPGALGDAATFSFYPGKNLGAYGDGGAVVSRDAELVDRVRRLSDHGRTDKYVHAVEGVNSRLDGMQAGILRIKLRRLDEWSEARRRHARQYADLLRRADVLLPTVHPDAEPVWHLFVVRVAEREALQARLRGIGVETGVHYPLPLHRQPAFRHLGVRAGTLPVTERVASQVLSLPMYAELSDEQIEHVVASVARPVGNTVRALVA